MAVAEEKDAGDVLIDPLLAQPRMVADPRISIAQAGVVLGKRPSQVRRLIALGRLPRHGPASNTRPLVLSEVEALRDKGEPIKLVAAARRLGCPLAVVRQLIADGTLPMVPAATTLVYPADVRMIAEVMSDKLPRKPGVPEGYVGTAAVASRLSLSVSSIRVMAADGRLPAVSVAGKWYFDPDRIEMIRRARRASALRSVRSRSLSE
ncbi:hypothetical protein AB0H36_44035 [Kribbella sp. NPDC050820]|uniref:helix-turn-helix domain-containing protein n=1 Tax=Kribbella sp. NPDC050820 TaxID=3155408 RepID=UPI0033E90FB2